MANSNPVESLKKELSYSQKAAGVIVSLGAEKASQLYQYMEGEDVEALTLEVARMVREDFLQQNAFTDIDGYSSYDRQGKLLALILRYEALCRDAIAKGADVMKLFDIPVREKIGRAKSVPADEYVQVYEGIGTEMEAEIAGIAAQGGDN